MLTKTRTAVLSALLALLASSWSHEARGDGLEAGMVPTSLTIQIETRFQPIHNIFTRFLTFENLAGNKRRVAVRFHRVAHLQYQGEVTDAALGVLQSLAVRNNRSYWDRMSFENRGGSTALNIRTIEVEIAYPVPCCNRQPTSTIAFRTNAYLDAGYSSIRLGNNLGRIRYAMNFLGLTSWELGRLPEAFKLMVYDLGKSGSSGASDSTDSANPKYSNSSAMNLCSETISWYYYETGVDLPHETNPATVYSFRDVDSHRTMHDYFKNAGRLYCYHDSREQWIRKDRSYRWVYGDTYDPQPGDFLDRRDSDPDADKDNGHAMMLAEWDDANGFAWVMDGPYNINFRAVEVRADEQAGRKDYCVGRIPEND